MDWKRLVQFALLGSSNLEQYAILLVRVSIGLFFAISGANKLFVAGILSLLKGTASAVPLRSGISAALAAEAPQLPPGRGESICLRRFAETCSDRVPVDIRTTDFEAHLSEMRMREDGASNLRPGTSAS